MKETDIPHSEAVNGMSSTRSALVLFQVTLGRLPRDKTERIIMGFYELCDAILRRNW